jgi:hypothetical protein
MIKKIGTIIFILLFSENAFASPETDAVNFVEELHLGKNLYNMSNAVVRKSQTYQIITSKIGKIAAEKLVDKELRASINQYQSEWNKNLALSYLEYFTPSELNSLAQEKMKSKYFNKMKNKQKEVGVSMQKKSQDLLIKITSQALNKSLSQIQ